MQKDGDDGVTEWLATMDQKLRAAHSERPWIFRPGDAEWALSANVERVSLATAESVGRCGMASGDRPRATIPVVRSIYLVPEGFESMPRYAPGQNWTEESLCAKQTWFVPYQKGSGMTLREVLEPLIRDEWPEHAQWETDISEIRILSGSQELLACLDPLDPGTGEMPMSCRELSEELPFMEANEVHVDFKKPTVVVAPLRSFLIPDKTERKRSRGQETAAHGDQKKKTKRLRTASAEEDAECNKFIKRGILRAILEDKRAELAKAKTPEEAALCQRRVEEAEENLRNDPTEQFDRWYEKYSEIKAKRAQDRLAVLDEWLKTQTRWFPPKEFKEDTFSPVSTHMKDIMVKPSLPDSPRLHRLVLVSNEGATVCIHVPRTVGSKRGMAVDFSDASGANKTTKRLASCILRGARIVEAIALVKQLLEMQEKPISVPE